MESLVARTLQMGTSKEVIEAIKEATETPKSNTLNRLGIVHFYGLKYLKDEL